jgi:hypothetical protein
MFVGHEEAGDNIDGLDSLTATCDANGVEPIAYLTDVLGRIGSHPAFRLGRRRHLRVKLKLGRAVDAPVCRVGFPTIDIRLRFISV